MKWIFVNIGFVSYKPMVALCFAIALFSCQQSGHAPKEPLAIADHTLFYLYFQDAQDQIHQSKI